MPAGGIDCDCHCGGTVCTKWFVTGSMLPEAQLRDANDAPDSACPGRTFGPAAAVVADAQHCRTTTEFAYDTETFELTVSVQTPPSVHCFAGEEEEDPAPVNACQRRVNEQRTGWRLGIALPYGLNSVSALKVIKLRAGQRVRVRMVTDNVVSADNTFGGDLFYVANNAGNGVYWNGNTTWDPLQHGPAVAVRPADQRVWDSKPCALIGATFRERWYDAGVWPYDPPLAPWTYNPPGGGFTGEIDTGRPTMTHGFTMFDAKAKTCYMEAEPNKPPEEHPTAPISDKHPVTYQAAGNSLAYFASSVVSTTSLWNDTDGPWVQNAPGSALAGEEKYSYRGTVPNWFATQYMYWPYTRWVQESDFVSLNSTAITEWRRNYFSNPNAYRAQTRPEDPVEGEPTPPEPEPNTGDTFKTYTLIVPKVSRGREAGAEYYPTAPYPRSQMLRPDQPTDTTYVNQQIDGWRAHFENVTIHDFQLPEYPITSTARERVIETPTAFSWRARYTQDPPGDTCGTTGKQNGCVASGLCDLEMVVEVTKTGPWVFMLADGGNILNREGSTSVFTFVVESLAEKESELDPDVWEAEDLRAACKPNDTPDLTGWVAVSSVGSFDPAIAPFMTTGGVSAANLYPPKRVGQEPFKCKGISTATSRIGNQQDVWVSTFESNPSMIPIRTGATFTAFREQPQYVEPWVKIPLHVIGEYATFAGTARCCGYDQIEWPLVPSSCHKNNNFDQLYSKRVGYDIYSLRNSHPSGPSFNPPTTWVLPW